MPSTRSAGRAKTQKAREERIQRQQDRNALLMPIPPRLASSPVEADMLSLFGSIMHGVHCATRQAPAAPRPQPPGQWVLTDALLNSPNALTPESIVGHHNNAKGGRQNRLNQLSNGIADASRRGVDPQVLFFLDLMVKAEKAVAQVKETRGRSVDHLSAYLRAFQRDVASWADRELSEAQVGSGANALGPRSANSAPAAQISEPQSAGQTRAAATATRVGRSETYSIAADMPPPLIRPSDIQPQRKTAQLTAKRGLIVRLNVRSFPGDSDNNSSITTSSRITGCKRHAAEEPATADPPATKKFRTLQEDSSSKNVTVQRSAGPVRRSGRKAPITMSPQPQLNTGSQQEDSNSKITGTSGSGSSKRKAPMHDADNELVPEQPTKRRRAAAPQSKAPRTIAVKKLTKTAKATTPAATTAATAATAASPSATPTPAPTPAPTTKPAALPPRQRNGDGPVTGRDGFELIGPEPRFKLGQNDEALLTLRFYRNDEAGNRVLDSYTWRGKTDNRTPADIDWDNPKDIKILNKWTLQYLSRTWKCNGLRPDMMSRVWMDEEFEWLANQARHYHSWSKDDMPNQREKMEEFNEEWEGEQIPFLNMEGDEVVTQPRPERTVAAIASAMRRDEDAHPERWVGTHLEGRSKVKRDGAKGKEEEEL